MPIKKARGFLMAGSISLIALIFLFYVTSSFALVFLAILLCLLELALSFDNAVVNVKTLVEMPLVWQKRFLYIGLPIAVFGMRLVFPVVMVASTTPLSLGEVVHIALYQPNEYARAVQVGLPLISGFGGAFLLMVFFNYFAERGHKEGEIKNKLKLVLRLFSAFFLVLFIGVLIRFLMKVCGLRLPLESENTFFWAYFFGALLNFLFQLLRGAFQVLKVAKAGLIGVIGFLYLEFLDASFSLDGVLGAFALTENLFVIMVGLGIGALFVRTFTLQMLANKTLQKWKYLDLGAHISVGFLGIMMLIKVFVHVPAVFIAGGSFLMIILSIIFSIFPRHTRNETNSLKS
jgi:hypothetical protein